MAGIELQVTLRSLNLSQFINTDRRLGNSGAAPSSFRWHLGSWAATSKAATRPPSTCATQPGPASSSSALQTAERRKAQEGWDVFKHQVNPAIDPDNYKPPTVGAVSR